MSREHGSMGRRYWSSLTGVGSGPIPERNWRGQPFWRRYVASFFVLPQPPRQGQASLHGRALVEPVREPRAGSVSQPRRARASFLLRFQPALLAGTAVLAVVVVSVSQLGPGGGSSGNPGPGVGGPTVGATSDPGTQPSFSGGGPVATTSEPNSPPHTGPWQGTVRVEVDGTHVADGPTPGPGTIFGLGLSGAATLDGMGNLAPWSKEGTPSAADCSALLRSHSVYQLTVKAGDRLCIATLTGGTAVATVADEGTDPSSNSPYVDLNVVVSS